MFVKSAALSEAQTHVDSSELFGDGGMQQLYIRTPSRVWIEGHRTSPLSPDGTAKANGDSIFHHNMTNFEIY